jgi:hypothetical protein
MSSSTKRALIAAVVMSMVAGLLTTPDVITVVAMAAVSFVLIFGALLVGLRFLPVASWPVAKQRTFIWLVAVGIGAGVTFLPWMIHSSSR